MNTALPTTGTTALLDQLSAFVPDDFINQLLPAHRGHAWLNRPPVQSLLKELLPQQLPLD